MTVETRCSCGVVLRAPAGFESGRAVCPVCRSSVTFSAAPPPPGSPNSGVDTPLPVEEFLDPPPASKTPPAPPLPPWTQRMAAALLDPRSIQWMMMLGGGLMVLGLIVWLVSKGIFQNTLVVAGTLTAGALLVHAVGCFVALKTRYKIAGQSLTFLGCILIPLNLWFYHAHDLLTLQGNLWIGGVVCCAIYVATLLLLRDPLFMYAIEAGITLTVVLLLASQNAGGDPVAPLVIALMGLALVSIHAERAFPIDDAPFDRKRFGLPVFWSGHVQMAAALVTLLVSQILAILVTAEDPFSYFQGWKWTGNWLSENVVLAGAIWLLGAYAYFYSDVVVRRIGVYVYLAAACLIAAELTIIGDNLPAAVLIAAPAVTAVLLTIVSLRSGQANDRLQQNLQPLALLLSAISVVIGVVEHVRATSEAVELWGWGMQTGWEFVVAMVLVTACMRGLAVLFQNRNSKIASAYLFLSAAGVLVLVAGILRPLGVTQWSHQAPVLMFAPIGYILAARLWRGRQPERPLAIAAHVGAGVILVHLLCSTVQTIDAFLVPVRGSTENLWLALVFGEATVFYLLAAFLRRHGANIYAATACACAVVWQMAGYYNVPTETYTVLYAVLGLIMLAGSRLSGVQHVRSFHASGGESSVILGRGAAAFYSATALLSLAFLSALLQGMSRLATNQVSLSLLGALAISTLAGMVALVLSPSPTWRRVYVAWTVALACVSFLTLNVLIDLTMWQKAEIFSVVLGVVLLIAGYIGRFLEGEREEGDSVTLSLFLGSLLPPAALLIGTLYYRFYADRPSLPDEAGLVLVTVLMLVTGYSWQIKAPTMFGGVGLVAYLLVLVGMLAVMPNVAMGVYLAVGGGLLFAAGVALSVYRERLLALPDKIKAREGVFRVLSWR